MVDTDTTDYVLKFHQNIYGHKQSVRVCKQYLTKRLIDKDGFKQSSIEIYIFYKGNFVYVIYMDDSILAVSQKDEVNKEVWDIQNSKLNIKVCLQDILETKIDSMQYGSIHLAQPHPVNQILGDIKMRGNCQTKIDNRINLPIVITTY